MLRAIEFTDKRFMTKEDYNFFSPITKNAIILCNNYRLMDTLAKEIINTVNGAAEYNNYDCDDEDVGQAKLILSFGLQRVININGQKITLALEPAMIYNADALEDIWLFDYQGNVKNIANYKEFIYPLSIFKGVKNIWTTEESGKYEIYRRICNGRYGTYDGKWVNIEV